LFGDKLYAGQLPINLGNNSDPDAAAFFQRVSDAGGTLSATEQQAILTLVADLKNSGIWTKMKAIYPFVGASAAACAQNLKNSSFTGTFNGGWTFASTGVKGNGSNTFMNTQFIIHNNLNFTNQSYIIYKTNVQNAAICEFGVSFEAPTSFKGVGLFLNNGLGYISTFVLDSPFAVSTISGNYILNRINGTEKKLFRNGNLFDTKNDVAENYNYVANTVFLGARNDNFTPSFISNTETRFFGIGEGLTDTEASQYYTSIQAFQTTLSRQV